MFKKMIISTIISSGVLLAQSSAGININEDDLEIEGVLDSRNLAALQTSSTIFQADVNFINIDSADQEATLLGAGIGATNKLEGVEGVELTFGAKFIWTSTKENFIDDSYTYLPLMAKIRYVFPPLMFNIPPISLEGKLLYAPGALAFGDSDKYSEFRAAADIEMIENVKVYGGYRNIVAGFEGNTDYTFNNGWFAGLKFTY
jgi:hypothetical protein